MNERPDCGDMLAFMARPYADSLTEIDQLRAALAAANARAEAAEAKLALVDLYTIHVVDRIIATPTGTTSYPIFSAWLEKQEVQP